MAKVNNARAAKAPVKAGTATTQTGNEIRKYCILIAIFAVLLYANTLRNGYAGDDNLVVAHNLQVAEGIKGIPAILTSSHLQGFAHVSRDTYRPLSLVLFAIEYQFFGDNPVVGHFMNILLYAGCVVLLLLFFNRLLPGRRGVALLATLLFTAHPIHTDVVANIKSSDELLCFLFAFLSLNLFMKYTDGGGVRHVLAGALCMLLSLMSKETAICFVAIVPLVFLGYYKNNRRRSLRVIAAMLGAAALFLVIRTVVLHSVLSGTGLAEIDFANNQLVRVPPGKSATATALVAMGYYLRLLFVPYPLLCSYSYNTIPFASFGSLQALLSLAAYVALAAIALYRLFRRKSDLWAFGILFFLLSMVLFSNLVFLVGALVAERFLFFGSVGFCLVAALGLERWVVNQNSPAGGTAMIRRPRVLLIIVPLLCVYSALTVNRNADWVNDYTLYKTDAEKAPANAKLACNVSAAINTELLNPDIPMQDRPAMVEESMEYMRRGLAIYPGNAEAHAGLGQLYLRMGRVDSAEWHERRALALNPAEPIAIDNMAAVYFAQKKYDSAIVFYKKEIEMDPTNTGEFRNIGLCYMFTFELDSAMHYLKKALAANPDAGVSLYGPIADTYHALGLGDSSAKYEKLMQGYDRNFKVH